MRTTLGTTICATRHSTTRQDRLPPSTSSSPSSQHFETSSSPACIFAPDGCGSSLNDTFEMKMPAFADDDDAVAISVEERHLVSPKLMARAFLKWLIYTAAFKEPVSDARGLAEEQRICNSTSCGRRPLPASKTCTARSCSMRWRFVMKVSRQAGSGSSFSRRCLLDDPEHDKPARGAGARGAGACGAGAR